MRLSDKFLIYKALNALSFFERNYSRYDATMFDEHHKAEVRATQCPKDLEAAYELGKRLVREVADEANSTKD